MGGKPCGARREKGTVHTFFPSKGYGFIVPDGGGTDVFVHQSAVISHGFRSLQEGQRVEFEIFSENGMGRRRALKVDVKHAHYVDSQFPESSFQRPCFTKRSAQSAAAKKNQILKGSQYCGKPRWGSCRRTKEFSRWGTAPGDVIWVICLQLSHTSDLRNMRMVCKHWRRAVGASIAHLQYSVLTPRIHENFPLISSLDLSNRKPWEVGVSKSMMQEGLQALPKLGNLTELNLSGWSDLTDVWLRVIKEIPRLTSLDVSCCSKVSDEGWGEIGEMSHLQELDMQGCDKLQRLRTSCLTSLVYLNLSRCSRITNCSLGFLTSLVSLEILDLSACCCLSGAGLEKLSGVPKLITLDLLEMKHLGDEDAEGLARITSLRQLVLGEVGFTDVGIASLKAVPSLHLLKLVSVPLLGFSLSNLQSLTWLRCENCYNLDDTAPFFMAQLTGLRSLSLASCVEITSDGALSLMRLTNLTELDLSDMPELDDEALEHLTSLKGLQLLDLSGAHWGGFTEFTDSGVLALQAFPGLTSLNLSRWAKLSDVGLSMLQVLTNLEDLDLSWCKEITTKGMGYLQKLKKLSRLDISWCLGLDGQKIKKMFSTVDIAT